MHGVRLAFRSLRSTPIGVDVGRVVDLMIPQHLTLRRFAAAEHFPFLDITDGDRARFSSYREYSDYHHMSPDGASRFTALLAAQFQSRFAGIRLGE